MTELNFAEPVSSKSKAWCMNCDWKAWGIWAHSKANAHHRMHAHLVQLNTPTEAGLTPD